MHTRLREVLEGKGIKESKQGGYIYSKLKGTEVEVTRATVARWLKGDGVPQPKHFQAIFTSWNLTDGEVVYLLTGVRHQSAKNAPEYNDFFLTMEIFSKMKKFLKEDNPNYEDELSNDRIRAIFESVINIVSLSKSKVLNDSIIKDICTS